MNNMCKFYKFCYCKMKENCEKEHVKEECLEGSFYKSIQTCVLRHTKMCNKIGIEGLCQFGNKCAYNHRRAFTSQCIYTDAVHHDVQKLKDEVDNRKNFIQSLLHIIEEADELKKSVKDIKKELNL